LNSNLLDSAVEKLIFSDGLTYNCKTSIIKFGGCWWLLFCEKYRGIQWISRNAVFFPSTERKLCSCQIGEVFLHGLVFKVKYRKLGARKPFFIACLIGSNCLTVPVIRNFYAGTINYWYVRCLFSCQTIQWDLIFMNCVWINLLKNNTTKHAKNVENLKFQFPSSLYRHLTYLCMINGVPNMPIGRHKNTGTRTVSFFH
jgi:hypothetical protein